MTDPRAPVFEAVRDMVPGNPFNLQANIDRLHSALDQAGCPRGEAPPPIGHNRPPACTNLTAPMVLEIVEHEGIVREAYLDSRNIWTWGVGVTDKSGHKVGRYKDNPASLEHCLAVYIWLLRDRYLPQVLDAFQGHPLAEHELAAALSFHWNTGAIGRADWVKLARQGKDDEARAAIMNWRSPPEIIPRRKAERELFFAGRWTSDGLVPVYGVNQNYKPSGAQLVDIRPDLAKALEA